MYRRMGSSESSGDTSPYSDLNGAPNRRRAVGELSSEISHLTCSDISSRFRSAKGRVLAYGGQGTDGKLAGCGTGYKQCSCFPVKIVCFDAGAAARTGSSVNDAGCIWLLRLLESCGAAGRELSDTIANERTGRNGKHSDNTME